MLARRRIPRRALAFGRDNTSVAALELAIVLPLLLALLAGVYDISELVIIRAEVYAAAESMVSSASSLAVQQDSSTALTYDQVQETESLIWADVPSLRGHFKASTPTSALTPISITMSSVLFYPKPHSGCKYNTTTSCNYIADVAWSESYTGSASGVTFDYADPNNAMEAADCDTNVNYTNQVAATASLSLYQNVTEFRTLNISTSTATAQPNGKLAVDAGIAPILAVSIQFTYNPLFSLYLTGPFTFWVDAYWPVRSVKTTSAFTNSFGDVVEPLSQQFTAMVATSTTAPTNLPTTPNAPGTPIADANAAAYCINPMVSGSYTSNP